MGKSPTGTVATTVLVRGNGVIVTSMLVGVVVAPRGLLATMTVKGPVGVEDVVPMCNTLVTPAEVGITGFVSKAQVTPAGRGVTQDKSTVVALPPVRVATMVTLPDKPCWILMGPLLNE